MLDYDNAGDKEGIVVLWSHFVAFLKKMRFLSILAVLVIGPGFGFFSTCCVSPSSLSLFGLHLMPQIRDLVKGASFAKWAIYTDLKHHFGN